MRKIGIFETNDSYFNRINDDNKIIIFKKIWPGSLHNQGEMLVLLDDMIYSSKSIKKYLDTEKKKNFIKNILLCNWF